uniref:Zinc finger BED-type containing 3 n=1 Tax=Equus asinus TaxID=9793 RepID=A0A9L0IE17_EQUAS
MRSGEPPGTMDESGAPAEAAAQGGPCPGLAPAPAGRLGAPYSEDRGYFHLAPARPGHAAGRWATCRLVRGAGGPRTGLQAGAPALWEHLKSAPAGAGGGRPPLAARPRAPPRARGGGRACWSRWARWPWRRGSLRERELARREAAVEQGERALERRRRAAAGGGCARRRPGAPGSCRPSGEALQARLREVSRREGALALAAAPPQTPLKEDPDGERDGCLVTRVLL